MLTLRARFYARLRAKSQNRHKQLVACRKGKTIQAKNNNNNNNKKIEPCDVMLWENNLYVGNFRQFDEEVAVSAFCRFEHLKTSYCCVCLGSIYF